MRAAALVALLLASPLAAGADDASASAVYFGPSNPVFPRIDCPMGLRGCIGGAVFEATGLAPLRIEVADVALPVVDVLACQDVDGNGRCGEPGEPRFNQCGTTFLLDDVPFAFRGDLPTTVYVIAGARCADLVESVGTITVTYG